MSPETREVVRYRLARAHESVAEARLLLANDHVRTAVNRLYYTCVYAVSALLLAEGRSSPKHSGVRALFDSTGSCRDVSRGAWVSSIADVLVRNFNQTYENIYSFYLARPSGELRWYACRWLVAMTEKSTGAVRVGTGSDEWSFEEAPPQLATNLLITIANMQVPPATATPAVFAWIAGLSYPWSSLGEVRADWPAVSGVQTVLEALGGDENAA